MYVNVVFGLAFVRCKFWSYRLKNTVLHWDPECPKLCGGFHKTGYTEHMMHNIAMFLGFEIG
jgi:hypothetical protein